MNLQKKQRPIIISASIIIFAALIVTMLASTMSINQRMREYCVSELEENAEHLADDLYNSIQADTAVLQSMAAVIASQETLDDASLAKIMQSFDLPASYITYVEYLSSDGRLLMEDGTVLNASKSLDFQDEAAAAPYMSEKAAGIYDTEDLVLRNAVPVVHSGKAIGILYGVTSLREFSKLFRTDIYDGDASFYMMDGTSGDFLMDTWHSELGNFYALGSRETLPGYDLNTTVSNLKSGIAGHICFTSATTGETLYLYYCPVGVNNWNVLISVEEHVALAQAQYVNRQMYITILVEVLLLLVFMGIVVALLVYNQRTIQKLGMEDQTTGLPNRNAYDKYVSDNRQVQFTAMSCIFVDANGLHEVNNRYGHDVGDQLLRAISDVLKKAFSGKPVFRLGGDEFIVFADGADSEACQEAMENAAETLSRQDYSISYGIASRKDEMGLERLIHDADEKMLEQKKRYYESHNRRR